LNNKLGYDKLGIDQLSTRRLTIGNKTTTKMHIFLTSQYNTAQTHIYIFTCEEERNK
jgi:hypothetical protein